VVGVLRPWHRPTRRDATRRDDHQLESVIVGSRRPMGAELNVMWRAFDQSRCVLQLWSVTMISFRVARAFQSLVQWRRRNTASRQPCTNTWTCGSRFDPLIYSIIIYYKNDLNESYLRFVKRNEMSKIWMRRCRRCAWWTCGLQGSCNSVHHSNTLNKGRYRFTYLGWVD